MDPATLGALAVGGADFLGGVFTNRSSAKEAERNRRFQERMSSTSIQRRVADYEAAGLNPALAYDREASSPGGSVAQFENPVGRAASSAAQAASIQLTKAQAEKVQAEKALLDTEISVRTMTQEGEPTWRAEKIAERVARLRDLAHQGRLQPHDEQLRELAVEMQRALLAGGQFKAETFGDIDKVRDFIKAGLSSSKDAAEAFRAWLSAGGSIARGENARLGNRIFRGGRPGDRFGIFKKGRDDQ